MTKLTIGGSTHQKNRSIGLLRNSLLSPDPARLRRASATIDDFLDAYPAIRALSVYERIRKWVNNELKPAKAIYDAVADAKGAVAAEPGSFTARWVLAIAYKYARQFDDSEKHYGIAAGLAPSRAEERDLRADWGELYVYVAKAGVAKLMIEDAGETVRWHPWGYAFALHQYAFEEDPSDGATDTKWYEASNAALEAWPALPVVPDAQLLVAANWGGIARRRGTAKQPDSTEIENARTAVAAFMAANPGWTIRKEKRGPFIKGLPLASDPQTGTDANKLKKYRKEYAKHFFDNLRVGRRPGEHDLDETGPDDGENPPGSDPEA